MATGSDFKELATKRLKTVDVLIADEEWAMAAYMLGFVLECCLKAASCKALNLDIYPEPQVTKNSNITSYFCTHNHDMLLAISGASDIFGFAGKGSSSWSGFTQEFQGSWTNIRYDNSSSQKFDEKKVKGMLSFLVDTPDGIIPLLDSENKW